MISIRSVLIASVVISAVGLGTTLARGGWAEVGLFSGPTIFTVLLLVTSLGVTVQNMHLRALRGLAGELDDLADGALRVSNAGQDREDEVGALVRAIGRCARAMERADAARLSMSQMALTDPLTGLANRRGLNDVLEKLDARDPDPDTQIALMHLDLDHFKAINDRLGHDAGDFVLRQAVSRIQQGLGPDDLLARIGGDEFLIVAQYQGGIDNLTQRAKGLVRRFHETINYDDEVCSVGLSVGVVVAGTPGKLAPRDQAMIHADIALTQAKTAGRGRYVLFDPSMARDREKERAVAADLHNSFGRGAFETWFQPMVDIHANRLTGVEMLVRWRHPERGLVLPTDFLWIAESRNLTQEISAEAIPLACRRFRAWLDEGIKVPKLYLNLSRSELVLPNLVEQIRWVLDDADLTADRIAVEVEEHDCAGRGVELIFENLSKLSELGVEIVLEGFGATDASIANVIRLGVGKIKLSRTIIDRMRGSADHATVVPLLRGLIGFGSELGISMVGKGVTVPSQIVALRGFGCNELQGDAIAPAMPAGAARTWLTQFGAAQTHPIRAQA